MAHWDAECALGEAVFRVHGELAGAFLSRYNAMRKDGVLRTIDASPVGAALAAYLAVMTSGFNGTLSELLDRLDRYQPHGESWPRSAKGLGDALRRLAPALRRHRRGYGQRQRDRHLPKRPVQRR